jgi:omega-6 fatty acid desaturase (delta-12 desaturase)
LRTGRHLIEATRLFSVENRVTSWWHLCSTTALLVAGLIALTQPFFWPLRLLLSLVTGLLVVREFILYHDHLHGALLRGSWPARMVLYPFGIYCMTPPRVWRETHNYHHAHTAKLVGSNIGSYATMTTQQWAEATPTQRRHYKLVRHPLTVLCGYFTIFMMDMCLMSFLRSPRKRYDSLIALVVNWAATVLIIAKLGFAAFFFVWFLPLAVACATGAYLFYAQHNFDGLHIQMREDWSYERAALESSSYMETGKLMGWFTGNIGYHHVHHLNPCIPFYRLPEAMAALPELQNPGRTRLRLRDVAANFRLKLWDCGLQRMVGFPDVEATARPRAGARAGVAEPSA